jgi:hypothetical protein
VASSSLSLDYVPAGLQIRPFNTAITFQTSLVFLPGQPQSELSQRLVAAMRKRLALELGELNRVV